MAQNARPSAKEEEKLVISYLGPAMRWHLHIAVYASIQTTLNIYLLISNDVGISIFLRDPTTLNIIKYYCFGLIIGLSNTTFWCTFPGNKPFEQCGFTRDLAWGTKGSYWVRRVLLLLHHMYVLSKSLDCRRSAFAGCSLNGAGGGAILREV